MTWLVLALFPFLLGAGYSFTWDDTNTQEERTELERSANGGSFFLIGQVGPNVTTAVDEQVLPRTDYCWRVRACNVAGCSPPSNAVCLTTPEQITETVPVALTWERTADPPQSAHVVFAVNAGGPAYTAADGTAYQADTAFSGGDTYKRVVAIDGTEDDVLYHTERYGNFSYAVPLPDGAYNVVLQFAEVYCANPCSRIFTVTLEGQTVLDHFELMTQPIRTAYDVTVPVTIQDGQLDVSCVTDWGNAKLSALRVERK